MDVRSYRRVEPLYTSRRTTVWRAIQEPEGLPVVLKRPAADQSPPEIWEAYRREAQLLTQLSHPGVIRVHALVESGSVPLLVLEDVQGQALPEWRRAAAPNWRESLDIAVGLAEALVAVHAEHMVHLALAPAHVLVSELPPRVHLIDFQHAQQLYGKEAPMADAAELAGSLAYVAPEQTGRLTRPVDARADLYSLGATLYFLFTGVPPFVETTALALVHAHLARLPASPREVEPDLPPALSELVLRLLRKEPDDRYQSAAGVLADLVACQAAAASDPTLGRIVLGRADDPVVLPKVSRLFGDDPVTRAVSEAWTVVRDGGVATVLIRGVTGSGKSARLNQAAQRLVDEAGLVLAGRFEPDQQAVPYAGVFAMLEPVVTRLLQASDAELTVVRGRLAHRLGPDAGLLTGIWHWDTLLGDALTPERPFGSGTPDLRRPLLRLIETLSEDRPVVLAWDDVDWADQYTEGVMRALVGAELRGGLLIMATATADPNNLQDRVRSVWGTTTGAHTVVLPPLDLPAIRTWLAETLKRPLAAVNDLAKLLTDRSGGNPAGVQELLETLWREDAVRFDRAAGGWVWDAAAAQRLEPRAPVTATLRRQLAAAPPTALRLLRWAACLGMQFDPVVLADALNWPRAAIGAMEGELRGTGAVEPVPGAGRGRAAMRFVHRAVWETLRSETPLSERQAAHGGLARALASRRRPDDADTAVYELANHFNAAGGVLTAVADQLSAARANLAAARRAAQRGAWQEALAFSESGTKWVAGLGWEQQYDITRDLYEALMAAQYARQDFDASLATARILQREGRSFVDRAAAYRVMVRAWAAAGRLDLIQQEGREFVRDAGLSLPEVVTPDAVRDLYASVSALAAQRPWEEWLNAWAAPKDNSGPVLELVAELAATGAGGRDWTLYLELMGLAEGLAKGWGGVSPAFCFAPSRLLDLDQDDTLAEAVRWGKLGRVLLEKMAEDPARRGDPTRARQQSLPFLFRLAHFQESWLAMVERLDQFDQWARATGATALALGRAPAAVVARWLSDERLDLVLQRTEQLRDEAVTAQVTAPERALALMAAGLARWQTGASDSAPAAWLAEAVTTDERLLAAYLAAWDALLFADPATALDRLEPVSHLPGAEQLEMLRPELRFLEGAALLLLPSGSLPDQAVREQAAKASLNAFARQQPTNYRAKALLLAALDEARAGAATQTERFAEAAAAAQTSDSMLVAAFTHEQAARVNREQGHQWDALPHLLAAFRIYARWGFTAKVRQLMAQHPELDDFVTPAAPAPEVLSVDLEAMVQTSTALAREVQLDRLIGVLLETARMQAGAERGALLLERSDGWWLEAIRPEANDALSAFRPEPLSATRRVPPSLIRYVVRTGQTVRMDGQAADQRFLGDPYFQRQRVRSVLALPVVKQGQTLAVLYLDNGLVARAFPADRVNLLQLWAGQAAVSIENARVYGELEARVAARTEDLAVALDTIRRAQRQMVEAEKMASLGQLTAGVAHEINNPVNFVVSSVPSLRRDISDLLELLDLYAHTVDEHQLQDVFAPVAEKADAIDVTYTRQEVVELLRGIEDGAQRTAEIVRGLRNFSRLDEDDVKMADVREGLDSTLMILKQQYEPRIVVERVYGDVPQIECYPGQLNQVFMNLLVNAIQAIPGSGTITVEVSRAIVGDGLEIRIRDSGVGMTPDVQRRIFEPFFTTKEVGEGTGLGLSISYGIIERHRGHLSVESTPGVGTTFVIQLPLRQGSEAVMDAPVSTDAASGI